MERMENVLESFLPTTLDGLNGVKLLQRFDTKFILHRNQLGVLFDYLAGDYHILEIDRKRLFSYENLYYDTDDFHFYHQHHNRKLNRYKVRYRKYTDSNQCFFEVKFKNNKRKTIKSRLSLENAAILDNLSEESIRFAKDQFLRVDGEIIDRIRPKLKIEYDRITFANQRNKQRLTIDTNLTYTDTVSNRHRLSNLVIAEVKSDHPSLNDTLFRYLKSHKIFPTRFSKYCMGVVITGQNVKRNRFKKKLMKLQKLV